MSQKNFLAKTLDKINALYGGNQTLSISVIAITILAIGIAVFLFFFTAAPNTITITSGPEGSSYQKTALKYQKILARDGITLKILPSDGSNDNIRKLLNTKINVDVGFVQGGDVKDLNIDSLFSLGSINYQPLMIFYHGEPKTLLSDFKGQKLDIGPGGSGTHIIALELLKANGIELGGDTKFVSTPSAESVQALLDGRIDVLFVMGDSTSSDLIRQLLRTPDINLFNFTQADGYTRRINYLNKLELPKGAIDFGKNIPSEDVNLVGPTVELIARRNLHPALSDALLEAAREVHSTAGLYRKRGEFPAPLEHEFEISKDASRFYATGKSFLYRTFPFWLASLINRIITVIVPLVLLMVPVIKLAPAIYRWRIQSRIYPWYKNLLEIERDALKPSINNKEIEELLHKLDFIEKTVNKMKIPASYGDLFYSLRGNISFVRERLASVRSKLTKT
jgi:TRAP-type uncharacterized transport system substrate-binding protein